MKRKYKIDLVKGNRIDVFLEDKFRVVTTLKQTTAQSITLEVLHGEDIKNQLKKIRINEKLRAIFYEGTDVYLFHTAILKLNEDENQIILLKPVDFQKVQRRQHVRSNWFMEVNYVETDDIDHLIRSQKEALMANDLSYNQKGIILNLSGGGFEVKVKAPIQSKFIACKFKYRGKSYHHFGVVRRRSAVQEFGETTYRTGIEFIKITEIEREKIINLVFEKIRTLQGKYY